MGIMSARFENLLPYAAAARCTVVPQGIEIFAEGTDRESLMRAGAAITCLRAAAAHFGFHSYVLYQRAPDVTPMAVLVALRATIAPDLSLARLFPAIARRHTSGDAFDGEPIDPQPLSDVCDLLDAHSSALRLVLPRDWPRVAGMLHDGQQVSHASMLVVVTAADDAIAIVKAGELAERVLLKIGRAHV